jgi:glycine/D-amino acid oxidase-like deaminating enzyme
MASKNRDLRTGVSVWQGRRKPSVTTRPLTRNLACDVLVIGAGISGALAAEMLAADGHDVCIVDRRGPFLGSTSANTALILYEIDVPLIKLARSIGRDDAVRAWRRSYQAVHALVTRTRALGLELEAHDSLYLTGNVLNARRIEQEAEARRQAGLETQYLRRSDLRGRFGIRRSAALLSNGTVQADPRVLTALYLNAALARGAKLHSPVDIVRVDAGARRVHAVTQEGHVVSCRRLVFATGYEVPNGVKASTHQIISTYAMATRPQPRRLWPGRCLIWEASDPYLYIRATDDGRVIAGGEDEKVADATKRDALLEKKTEAIRAKLSRILPDIDTAPVFAWTGTFGATTTGLPIIGEIPSMKNCWVLLGYGGNGITYSRIGAEILRTVFAGGSDPDADLYRFPKP